ncbi:hypothetical protein [Nonomuraea sp. GTA35]|uniref:hypothetical protein n=1 Tax=Nonomuraea sp. GTA35 TaxID=1676746 RepID=UPI0035C22288
MSASACELKQRTAGVLRPLPRVSTVTRSYRSRTVPSTGLVSRPAAMYWRYSMVEQPGPPLFTTREPCRAAGSEAGTRASASVTVAPRGRS